MQRMTGRLALVTGSGYGEGVFINDPTVMTAQIEAGFVPGVNASVKFDNNLQVRTSWETRPVNVALVPRLHM